MSGKVLTVEQQQLAAVKARVMVRLAEIRPVIDALSSCEIDFGADTRAIVAVFRAQAVELESLARILDLE